MATSNHKRLRHKRARLLSHEGIRCEAPKFPIITMIMSPSAAIHRALRLRMWRATATGRTAAVRSATVTMARLASTDPRLSIARCARERMAGSVNM